MNEQLVGYFKQLAIGLIFAVLPLQSRSMELRSNGSGPVDAQPAAKGNLTLPSIKDYDVSGIDGKKYSIAPLERWRFVYQLLPPANPYAQFKSYADANSIRRGVISGVSYISTRVVELRKHDGAVLFEDISMICEGKENKAALAVRRVGKISSGKIEVDVDAGEVESLEDFNLTNLSMEPPVDQYGITVSSICAMAAR